MKKITKMAIFTIVITAIMLTLRVFFGISFVWVSVVMTLFGVMTLYQATLVLTPILLEYLFHLNSGIKSKLSKYLIQENWDPQADKKKRLSEFGFKALNGVLTIVWLVLGSLALLLNFGPFPIIQWKCEHLVHSIAMILERVTTDGFGGKVAIFIWIMLGIMWIIFFAIWIKNMYTNLLTEHDEDKNTLTPLICWNVTGAVNHIYGFFLFSYGRTRFFQDLAFWFITAVLVFLTIVIILVINYLVNKED